MYIEQSKTSYNKLKYYLPLTLSFIVFMLFNFILSKDMDTTTIMHRTIDQFGVNGTFVLSVFPLSMGCFIVWIWVKLVHKQTLVSLTTSRNTIDWKRIAFSFIIWSSITIVLTLLAYFFAPEEFVINYKPQKFWIFFVLAIVLLPLQTSFEEYLFRAYTMQGLGLATCSRAVPFIVTSLLFGLMHIANPEVEKMGYIILIYYIGTGFFLGILTLMDEGLELALGFHAANNVVGALLLTSDWSAFQTHSLLKSVAEPSAGFEIIFPVFVLYPLLLIIFGKKYNWQWSNWQNKLFGKLNFNEINTQ